MQYIYLMENLDIVKLIEKNPITRLSQKYQGHFVNKLIEKFGEKEQQLFAASFYCYLNYDSKKDFVINLDDIWKWVGFSRKDHAKRLLEKYFFENIDYKIFSPQSGEKSTKGRPEEQILLTINTFKKFCMKAGTQKSDEIHDCYIKLEELLHEIINEETSDLRNQLLSKESQLKLKEKSHKIDLKREKHNTLVNLLKTKKCIYLGEIVGNEEEEDKEKKLIKIGSSEQVDGRINQLNYEYDNVIFLEIFECENFRDVEKNILSDKMIMKNMCKKQIKTNGTGSKEVVELSNTFTYANLLAIVKKYVNEGINTTLNSTQLLEKQKMDLEKQKIENELLLEILKNDTHSDMIKPLIAHFFPDLIKNIASNINKEKIREQIEEQIKEQIKEDTKKEIKEEVKMQVKNEIKKQEKEIAKKQLKETEKNIKIINPNNDIILDVNRNSRKPAGRKIQKIDPNDLTKVIKVYDSMMYLMRSPENIRFKKACIEKALKKNLIYKDYRWCFVEKDEDPQISHAKPTVASKIIDVDIILQLNDTKTKILTSFPTKKEAKKNLGITIDKLNQILQNGTKQYNYYLVRYSDCPKALLDKFDGSTIRTVKAANSLGPIKKIDPITKDEIIFNTFEEIDIRLGHRRTTIQKAIENKTLWGGSIWEYCKK
jgi:hypothetical protein